MIENLRPYLTLCSIISVCLIISVVIFISISLAPAISTILRWDEREADHAAAWECKQAGGKWTWPDYEGSVGKVCMKEYTSCGPDENRPGYTACEQKFKRIN